LLRFIGEEKEGAAKTELEEANEATVELNAIHAKEKRHATRKDLELVFMFRTKAGIGPIKFSHDFSL
jgi:hypothetical protein